MMANIEKVIREILAYFFKVFAYFDLADKEGVDKFEAWVDEKNA